MKILWFNWKDIKNPDSGGAEVYTHEIARRLVKMGHAVTLFTSRFEGCRIEEFLEGVKIVRDGGRFGIYSKARKYYLKHKDDFDMVIDEINTKPFMTPSYVKDKLVIALIHQLAREFWFYETPFPINFLGYYFLEKRWLSKYSNVSTITVSESTRKDLLEMGFNKVHIVPGGLSFKPLECIPQKEERPTLLFVGRLKKAKLPDHAIKAFSLIKKAIPDAQLWVVGGGYMRDSLKKSAPTGVIFFGQVSHDKKLELMRRAHLILVPGVREGWGLVVIEANAMGTPSVAYDVNGLRDSVINGKTGVLVKPKDVEAMARKAIQLLSDTNLRNALAHEALSWARNFTWEKASQILAQIVGLEEVRA